MIKVKKLMKTMLKGGAGTSSSSEDVLSADACERGVNQSIHHCSRVHKETSVFLQHVEQWSKLSSYNSYSNYYNFSPQQQLLILVLLIHLGVVFIIAMTRWKKRQQQKQKLYEKKHQRLPNTKLKRSASFTSAMLAKVTMPSYVNYPDPIINATILFDHDTCPTTQDVITDMILPLLQKYDRFGKIPMLSKKDRILTFRNPLIPLDPKKMVRRITIHENDTQDNHNNDNDKKLYDTIQTHLHDSLSARKELPWWEILLVDVSMQHCTLVILLSCTKKGTMRHL